VTDDKPPGEPFRWGLTPGGGEDDTPTPPPPTPPSPPEPVDQGYLIALDPQATLPPTPVPTPTPTPPAVVEEQPTQAFDFQAPYVQPEYSPPTYSTNEELEQQFPAIDDSLYGASSALVAQPLGMDSPSGESVPTSAIDSLFGESSFQEYDSSLNPGPLAFSRQEVAVIGDGAAPPKPPKPPRPPLATGQKALIWVAGGLVAALALVGLFLLGTQLAPVLSPDPIATPTPTPSATISPFDEILGPVSPGTYTWDELLGTECLEPFVSPWEEEFTVVDCTTPFSAQLVHRGTFIDSQLEPYPGFEVLQARMNLLCTSPANINYPAAVQFTDIQFAASFAANEQEWLKVPRDYFCFVSRSGGEPFTASVAMPDTPAPVIPTRPEPEP
jgi:hypothetical protein